MNLTKIIAHLAIIATTMGVLAEAGNVNQQAPRTGVSNEDAFVGPRSHANTPIVTPVPTPVPTAATPPPTPYAIPAPASNSATANAPQLPTKPSDKDNNNAKIGNNTPGLHQVKKNVIPAVQTLVLVSAAMSAVLLLAVTAAVLLQAVMSAVLLQVVMLAVLLQAVTSPVRLALVL
ncbi:hypothetical protein PF010_g1856 [Phytophthora fragariae]|uniref:RxLR effector protein n=1 Tax=Phytophthora fragariae TaxID=53985 RepID=A0A6G0NHQ7_9STRA|nr:hypothetical protein PF010_g1856 [Phytophthora fragariae]KAE9208741.1 hypothetical protein PF004_g16672 [Phytophthora fragariae]